MQQLTAFLRSKEPKTKRFGALGIASRSQRKEERCVLYDTTTKDTRTQTDLALYASNHQSLIEVGFSGL